MTGLEVPGEDPQIGVVCHVRGTKALPTAGKGGAAGKGKSPGGVRKSPAKPGKSPVSKPKRDKASTPRSVPENPDGVGPRRNPRRTGDGNVAVVPAFKPPLKGRKFRPETPEWKRERLRKERKLPLVKAGCQENVPWAKNRATAGDRSSAESALERATSSPSFGTGKEPDAELILVERRWGRERGLWCYIDEKAEERARNGIEEWRETKWSRSITRAEVGGRLEVGPWEIEYWQRDVTDRERPLHIKEIEEEQKAAWRRWNARPAEERERWEAKKLGRAEIERKEDEKVDGKKAATDGKKGVVKKGGTKSVVRKSD